MDSFLHQFAQSVDYVSAIRAPYNTDGANPVEGLRDKDITKLHNLVQDPAFKLEDLPAYLDALKNINDVGLDDRLLLLEKVLVLMSRLPNEDLSVGIERFVIGFLYKDLPHPPGGYLSANTHEASRVITPYSDVKYAFRSADGSNYNPLFPSLGMAGSPYARSVPSTMSIPKSALPDAGLVFDTLLRRDEFVPHPGGISSFFFAFADLVIHSIFNTNHTDWTINDASSYLDLSILYGSSQSQVDQVRRKDGTGMLWDDVFADSRLLFMPPSSCALLVLLSRNHNYIAQKILDINENGTYVSPPPVNATARLAQDDEIFHRARLVNCGFFMQIVLGDYVGAILGLVRDGSSWRLDTLMPMREANHEVVPRGEGNVVSVEFNLLYRWHAALSAEDADWTGKQFNKLFEGKDPNTITIDDFKNAAHKYMIPPKNVREWTFDGLIRDPNGRFRDDDLARILQDATENRAGAFQAKGTPEVLRVIEMLSIEQSRSWGACSLNEFRKFLGLKPYKTFEEWNDNADIHMAAAALYKNIDNLELHVGLQAEQAKKPGPGAGLCPGYTISRAILADAVALSRGDRFLTTEFTPFNLTSWGYQDCQYDTEDGSYGGLVTKLLFRTLPDHYPAGSAYAHFPFLDPVYMKDNVSRNPNLVDKYIWTRPRRPAPTVTVDTYAGVKQVLTHPHFMSVYDNRLLNITRSSVKTVEYQDIEEMYGAAHDTLVRGRVDVEKLLLSFEPGNKDWAPYFKDEVLALIEEKSFNRVGNQSKYVDIVRDVINLLPVHWISEEIIGLPLKKKSFTRGAWYQQDVYKMFADVGRYVFLNFDPVDDWHLRENSISACEKIVEFIHGHFAKIKHRLSASDSFNHVGIENYHSHDFLERALVSGSNSSLEELATHVFAAVVPTAAHFSQAVAHVVDFYLDNQQVRKEIVRLGLSHDKEAHAKVMAYAYEALRINPPVSIAYRTAAMDVIVDSTRIQAGERIFANIAHANMDPEIFGPSPKVASYNRPTDKAGIFGFGGHGLLASKFFESTVPTILATVFELKNLQRAPGLSGEFTRFTEDWHGSPRQMYIDSEGKVTPFPDSLVVQFG